MALGAIEFTTISRAQDFTTIKQNEDSKAFVDQTNIGHQSVKNQEQRATTVVDPNHAEWQNKREDAREKGRNEYSGDGGKKRNSEKKVRDQMIVKGRQSFDMKI